MREPFFLHLFPPQFSVLGRALPPLSLWHLAALEAIGSPLILQRPGSTIELGDLQAAVQVCLTRWPDQPQLKPRLRDWLQQVVYRRNERYLRQHAEAFDAYLNLHCRPPELREKLNEVPRRITAPSVLSRVAGLMAFPSFTLSNIWNDVTPGYALWLLCAASERETGQLSFITEEDDELSAPPDLNDRPDEELYAIALEQLGKEQADAWLAARQRSRKEEVK